MANAHLRVLVLDFSEVGALETAIDDHSGGSEVRAKALLRVIVIRHKEPISDLVHGRFWGLWRHVKPQG